MCVNRNALSVHVCQPVCLLYGRVSVRLPFVCIVCQLVCLLCACALVARPFVCM